MSNGGGGHHVRGARSDRACGDHDLAPLLDLGVRDSGQCHRLFVLAPPNGQLIPVPIKRFGKACDVPVAEYAEHPCKKRDFLAIDDSSLAAQITHQRLRHRQSNCSAPHYEFLRSAWIEQQFLMPADGFINGACEPAAFFRRPAQFFEVERSQDTFG